MSVGDYLNVMVNKNASDIYFTPGFPALIKIEGVTRVINEGHLLTQEEVKNFAYSLMKDSDIKALEEQWELNIGITIDNLGRFRVNILWQKGAIAMVVRYINAEPKPIESLGLPESLGKLVMEKRGLILVAGATGSGKSTTLASMIDYRNRMQHGHILTIEDPIEYVHSYKKAVINQREIGSDTKSYASALKNALREAPDVILIGEIRDEETMKSAINYAETGHLCLATIHSSNCIETLDRIINFFSEAYKKQLLTDLAHNLKAIICQRLIPGIDGKRVPAIEILKDSPYIMDLIQKGELENIREAFERSLEDEITTFDQSVLQLYMDGKIDRDNAIQFADSKHNVSVKIKLLEEKKSGGRGEKSLFIE